MVWYLASSSCWPLSSNLTLSLSSSALRNVCKYYMRTRALMIPTYWAAEHLFNRLCPLLLHVGRKYEVRHSRSMLRVTKSSELFIFGLSCHWGFIFKTIIASIQSRFQKPSNVSKYNKTFWLYLCMKCVTATSASFVFSSNRVSDPHPVGSGEGGGWWKIGAFSGHFPL